MIPPVNSMPGFSDGLSGETAPAQKKDPALEKVSRQFEAIFVNQMVESMRKTAPSAGFFPQSQAERVYRGMLDQEHAGQISESGQLGLSNMIYDHLLRQGQGK